MYSQILDKRLHVRHAKKSDIEWINRRYGEVDFAPSVFEKEVIAVAEYEGEKAGIGRLVSIDEHNLELGGMYVFEPFRGKGIASEIIRFLLKQAHLFQTVYCIPFQYLAHLYTQHGFISCPETKEVPQEVASKYRWCKEKYTHPTMLLFLQRLRYARFPFL